MQKLAGSPQCSRERLTDTPLRRREPREMSTLCREKSNSPLPLIPLWVWSMLGIYTDQELTENKI